MTTKRDSGQRTAEAELRSWIERLDPEIRKLARAVRAAMRKRLPTAHELAYDYKSFVVLAYSATERGIDGIASIAARPDGVRLYLTGGPQLSDPTKLLQGTGKQVRFLRLEAASRLAHPDVKALIDAAIEQARVRLPAEGKGRLVLRSDASKQRPRRKPTK